MRKRKRDLDNINKYKNLYEENKVTACAASKTTGTVMCVCVCVWSPQEQKESGHTLLTNRSFIVFPEKFHFVPTAGDDAAQ